MMKARREELAENLKRIRDEIPKHLNLIVVTKTFPASDIEILYQLGERDFAENRVQELVAKRDELQGRVGSDARWHYQGQIQSNKISILNRYADVIHSLDQERHIERIDSSRHVLLQVNLDKVSSGDESGEEDATGQKRDADGRRAGVALADSEDFARKVFARFGENFEGVMGVSPHHLGVTSEEIRQGFMRLREMSEQIRAFAPRARWISAGMSDDYKIAIAEGATHIRLGSSILGLRTPKN